ncbi:MAG: amino acid permease [Polyangiaceae bacterium]|nr:amino acid permease [Polyangiaceae bacterium]
MTKSENEGEGKKLLREMGGFENFAVSFSIISILTGAVLLYGYGLKLAGPMINTVGWPIVSLLTLSVAASMAEITSAWPTAGGLYFWAFRLGGRGTAWVTAWLNMVGQVTITAGINVAAAIYIIGAIVRVYGLDPNTKVAFLGPISGWYFQLTVMVVLMIPQVLINILGIKLTAKLSRVSVYWHIGGVFFIAAALLAFGPKNPLSFLFSTQGSVTPLEASSAEIGGATVPALVIGESRFYSPLFRLWPGLTTLYQNAPFVLVLALGMLQAQWTFTGYDASAHVSEETRMAKVSSAWGVFLSVAVSAVVGYILLLVLTACIPAGDVAATAADPYPVLYIFYKALPRWAAHVSAIFVGGAMWLCGLSSITSMARMWYAFARDGGLPGRAWLAVIHAKYRTPIFAILLTSVLSVLICLYAAAYFVVTSISTIALYLAYGIPIALLLVRRLRGQNPAFDKKTAPWNLGRKGVVINFVAVIWVGVITVVFCLPPNELVLWTVLGMVVFLAAGWWLVARRTFVGPGEAALAAMDEE